MSLPSGVRPSFWIFLCVAAVLLLASLGVREARRERDRWQRGREQSRHMESLAALQRAERQLLQAKFGRPAASLRELADAYLPGQSVEVRESEPEPLADAFRLRRGEVTFTALDWEALRGWMEKAESQALPWRVIGLDIESRLDGLHGVLRVEALDKAPPAP